MYYPRRKYNVRSCSPLHKTISPKHPVLSIIGFMKGKSAINMERLNGRKRNFTGESFWARGYWVSTVGYDLEQIKKYIREQKED